jgi:hypothetical protein
MCELMYIKNVFSDFLIQHCVPQLPLLSGFLLFLPKLKIMIHYHKSHNDTRLKQYVLIPEVDIYTDSLYDILSFAICQTRDPTLLCHISRENGYRMTDKIYLIRV